MGVAARKRARALRQRLHHEDAVLNSARYSAEAQAAKRAARKARKAQARAAKRAASPPSPQVATPKKRDGPPVFAILVQSAARQHYLYVSAENEAEALKTARTMARRIGFEHGAMGIVGSS